MSEKKKHLVFQNNDSGEGWYYAGPLDKPKETMKAIGHLLESELSDVWDGNESSLSFDVHVEEMTDEEVENLPDL